MSKSSLKFEQLAGTGYLNLRGDGSDSVLVAAVTKATGLTLPLVPNTVAHGERSIYWLGPDEWMLVGAADAIERATTDLRNSLQARHAAVNDLSGSFLTFRITGDHTVDLLAKACTLDLHPLVFKAGSRAQTGLGKANVLLIRHWDDSGFDIVVRRSFSDYLSHWLGRAGQDYGIEFT